MMSFPTIAFASAAVLAAISYNAKAGSNHGNKEGYNCDEYFASSDSLNGTFQSPTYPYPYPAKVRCRYHFIGNETQRVRIVFADFDLFVNPNSEDGGDAYNRSDEGDGDLHKCFHQDSVRVYVSTRGRMEMVTDFCGREMPVPIMSSGPSLTIEFESYHSSQHLRGFQALYYFQTDFAMTEGRQITPGQCEFAFNSSESLNGTFTSPNYPGLYPRDTACNYYFYGKRGQAVEIDFEAFDLEGSQPCTLDTASDYVEFSDFRTSDRGIWKHCGHVLPPRKHSENHFYRVSFRSDKRFDDRGFSARYIFKPKEDPYAIGMVTPTRTTRLASTSAAPGHQVSSFSLLTGFAMAFASLRCK